MVAREAVLAKAREWVGMLERTGNNDIWFNDDWGLGSGPDAAWCFALIQSAFWYADPSPTGKLPLLSFYCPTGVQWARDNGQSIEIKQAHLVQPGDIVFFSWDMNEWGRWTPGTGDHIGIVESYDGGDTIYTIEGNVGPSPGVKYPQGVHRRSRSISAEVVNFWRPSVFSGGPLTISPEDDMFDETIDRQALQQTAAAAQGLVAAVAVLDDLLRNTYNNATWASGGIAAITPTVQDAYNHAVWTWEKLKDVDFTAPPAALPGSPPAGDQADRLTALENRLTALEQGIARLVGPRPPVASPTAGPASGPT